jgi:membrane-associated phospholipid phosphatase
MHTTKAPHHSTLLSILLGLVYVIPIAIFTKLALEVKEGRPINFDIQVLRYIHRFDSPGRDQLVIFITNTASIEAIVSATLGLAIILHLLKRRREMAILLINVGGAAIINVTLKQTFARPRPELWVPVLKETDFSFPSGHAMMSSALAFSAIYLLWRTRWRWPAIVIGTMYVLAIGFSRLYLGVHYPTDIIGGWAISFIWVSIVAHNIARSNQARRTASPAR